MTLILRYINVTYIINIRIPINSRNVFSLKPTFENIPHVKSILFQLKKYMMSIWSDDLIDLSNKSIWKCTFKNTADCCIFGHI